MQKELAEIEEVEPGLDENANAVTSVKSVVSEDDLFLNTDFESLHVGNSFFSDDSSVGHYSHNFDNINRYFEGSDVLARWSDGLYYLGTILEVDDENARCYVKFEDGSEFWTLFQHLQRAQMQGTEIVCAVCENGESDPPNEIVLCDHCGLGYHQLCHNPPIGEDVLQPEVMWNCRGCVFATTAKKGGASKEGPNAEAMQEMKQALPYMLSNLKWDLHHKTNEQQCYCYCGGPGEWYIKMLQCCRCKQWFHEACIQCLEMPMLYGDRFYIFVCSVCNTGPEYLKRLDLDWLDVAHLVIFNLTILHNQKYHGIDTSIIPFVNGNWELLQMPKQYQKTSTSFRRNQLLKAYLDNQSRFKSGREVKKKMSLWSLRLLVPPPVPVIEVPPTGTITDLVINGVNLKRKNCSDYNVKARSSEDTSSNASTPVKTVVKVRSKMRVPDSPISTRFKCKSETSNNLSWVQSSTSTKDLSPVKRKRGRPCGSKNKAGRKAIVKKDRNVTQSLTRKRVNRSMFNDSTDDDNSSRGTLESIIPHPNDFNGMNNPFSNFDLGLARSGLSLFNAKMVKRKLNQDDLRVNKKGVVRLKRRRLNQIRSNGTSETSLDVCTTSEQDSRTSINTNGTAYISESVQTTNFTYDDLRSSVNSYFSASNRIASGERFTVLAKRVMLDGKIQYLIQWDANVA